MPRRKTQLLCVPPLGAPYDPTAPVQIFPIPRVWWASLESEELLERAAVLYPGSDYLPLAWISAVTYLRKQSRCGWVCDRFVSKVSAPPA